MHSGSGQDGDDKWMASRRRHLSSARPPLLLRSLASSEPSEPPQRLELTSTCARAPRSEGPLFAWLRADFRADSIGWPPPNALNARLIRRRGLMAPEEPFGNLSAAAILDIEYKSSVSERARAPQMKPSNGGARPLI